MVDKRLNHAVVIGTQWGDEGKGKLVDMMSNKFDVIARFNGGNNAGHTVIHNGEQVKLHVLPSGIFSKSKLLISQGAVFDPEVLLTELIFCKKHSLNLDLLIDHRVNLVMPYHKLMDGASEAWKGKKATGSVKVGIGYCYEDRNNRSGIRCEDLFYPKILKEKIKIIFPLKKAILEKVYGQKVTISEEEIYKRLLYMARVLKPYIGDVSQYVNKNLNKKKMLFEGAMATMLDASFGTYPYTVANNTFASALFPSIGSPAFPIHVIGVIKAYTTRVGGGPFPTEQINEAGELLQKAGNEIAATSGRIRRCGWLDLNILRFAHRLNNFSSFAVTKLDVLSVFSEIPVCVGYRLHGKVIKEFPAVTHEYGLCKPIYKIFPGWKSDISKVRKLKNLPVQARRYIAFIEQELQVPVKIISVGAKRDANIFI